MPMQTEDARVGNPIVTSREPVGPKTTGSKGSVGDVALMDAIAIVIGAWVLVFLIAISLRHHNI